MNVKVRDFKALKILTAVLLVLNVIISLANYRNAEISNSRFRRKFEKKVGVISNDLLARTFTSKD